MDSGAHFRKCDFQVHSPRDLQWKGPRTATDEERHAYARSLVSACRERGLGAIAITDHHDLAFAEFVRSAAADELDAHGALVVPEDRLIVFPGMELTLAVPCQALLIFDSTFPQDMFKFVLTALAIQPNADTASTTAPTRVLDQFPTLEKVHEDLDKHDFLRGRYILLPNVSESGGHTLLRQGQGPKYRRMPCVGGYLDGSIDQLGIGNRNIVEGRASEYGYRRIALFQTSDNRDSDHSVLGSHSTWVKWATPTAEALRQACLAQESRISQEPPVLPGTTISSLDVTNSAFFGPISVEFNPQYSALIGGRGTGKSTILEYLRWALCDQPPPQQPTDELPDFRRRLIQQTLAKHEATVDVRFVINGIPHLVRRESHTGKVRLKIGDGDLEERPESDVRSLLPVQAYSQKQLSSVSVRADELQRFVTAPIRHELDEIANKLADLGIQTREQHAAIARKRALERTLERDELAARSLSDQAAVLRAALVDVPDGDRRTIDQSPAYDEAQQLVEHWKDSLNSGEEVIAEATRRFATLVADVQSLSDSLPCRDVLARARLALTHALESANQALAAATRDLESASVEGGTFDEPASEFQQELDHHRAAYAAAKQRSSTHESKLKELDSLEERLRTTRRGVAATRGEVASAGEPEKIYEALRKEWAALHSDRSALLEGQCANLTHLSGGDIKAELRRGGGIEGAIEALQKATARTGLRRERIDAIRNALETAVAPFGEWTSLLDELELVALLDASQPDVVPSTPLLQSCGFSEKTVLSLATKFDTTRWLDLAVTPLEDHPVFFFQAREDEYIPFSNASAGQQATALLKTLLNQPGPPLVVDQPEDDLDNPVVQEVVGQLWEAKKVRQLIFSSHNANLVVNGDAELVVCCQHRTTGDRSKADKPLVGAIDVDHIRETIKKVMEGGERAFKLRRDKYGF